MSGRKYTQAELEEGIAHLFRDFQQVSEKLHRAEAILGALQEASATYVSIGKALEELSQRCQIARQKVVGMQNMLRPQSLKEKGLEYVEDQQNKSKIWFRIWR